MKPPMNADSSSRAPEARRNPNRRSSAFIGGFNPFFYVSVVQGSMRGGAASARSDRLASQANRP